MPRSSSYSARVEIELRVNGRSLQVSKVGPNRLYLAAPQSVPEPRGELVIKVDGREHRKRVTLHQGDSPNRVIPAEFAAE